MIFTPSPILRLDSSDADVLARHGLGSSRLALGLATLGGAWGTVNKEESHATVRHALERGVRVFDVAPAYGTAESLLGAVLKEWRGPIPIISTKVGRLNSGSAHVGSYDYSPVGMRRSLEASLRALGRPSVDLVFLHEPHIVPVEERPRVVAALRELQAAGLTQRLGLAGGHGEGWNGFVETGAFEVVMLFRRLDACIFDGLREDMPRVRRIDMGTYGASPLHMGLLGARYDEFVRERPDWVWGPQIDRAQRLQELAGTHGMALSTLAHRFAISLSELDRVVIGAGNRAQFEAALSDIEAGPLPRELFDAVCQINFQNDQTP